MTTKDYKELLPSLPSNPGIYKFLAEDETILYVGKAKNLKKRIGSYFGEKKHSSNKTRILVRNAHHLEYVLVESEQDALLLENTLIKKFQPRYNVSLKDGKNYSYICIKKERFPRVFFTRKVFRDGSTYFGPYTSKYRTRIILDMIKTLFPVRTCSLNLSEKNIEADKFKVCLEYHIKNCIGPCVGYESHEEYMLRIQQIKNMLKGNFKAVKDFLKTEMAEKAQNLEFEKAQQLKIKYDAFEDYQGKSTVVSTTVRNADVYSIAMDDTHAYVNYLKVINGAIINTYTLEMEKNLNDDEGELLAFGIQSLQEKYPDVIEEVIVPFPVQLIGSDLPTFVPQRGDKKKLIDLSLKNAQYFILQKKKEAMNRIQKQTSAERILKTLQEDLNMDRVPLHIECFDNSNIQGSHPVGSCVVFRNAKPAKKDYRHFNIKTVVGANDFASMEETVFRRYRRLLDEGEDLPQLVIIDGGKGQLSSAVKSLNQLEILDKITIIGIAKRLEEIYFPNDSIPIYINKKSESLKLIQQLRNEAHRFAINFHRTKRSENFTKTELTEIPGIGEKTAQKLLSHFKSVKKLKKASIEEIESLVGKRATERIAAWMKPEEN